ncbi:hydrogenase maturation protease [Streptomyces griseosporeus]|uniref:hydrogenase maturation protease n=1 Tax=Streptomyces griseosporeus TaxID=1910 RepID=UPI00167EADD1|nr:hydrogenase maturation protease [Streptomyces griseosporeus]GHF37412.1 peptidase M52 [Streptomyces griseosporeus]
MDRRQRIAVIGVGNDFRRDDGVGWAVVDRLRERAGRRPLPPGTMLATCDGEPGRLIGLWEGVAFAVVVDAAHAHPGTPGRVHRLELGGGTLGGGSATSSHGLGLGEAVQLAAALDRLPGRLVVYAVEGAEASFGNALSPAVAEAADALAETVEKEITRHWGTSAGRPS